MSEDTRTMKEFWRDIFSACRKTQINEYVHARRMRREFGWQVSERLAAARKHALAFSKDLRSAS